MDRLADALDGVAVGSGVGPGAVGSTELAQATSSTPTVAEARTRLCIGDMFPRRMVEPMALIERTRYEMTVPITAATAIAALTDFGENRSRVWPETSHSKVFRLHSLGPTWADVTEGVPFSWSRERYDWSEPGLVRLRQTDSNVALPVGTIEYRLTDTPVGCEVICERFREFKPTPRGHIAHLIMSRFGARLLPTQLRAGFGRYARLTDAG